MSEVLLHPSTKKAVDSFLERPSHALLISGSAGVGKTYLATYISGKLLNIDTAKIGNYPYFWLVEPNPSITIEQIRELQKNFKLKIPGSKSINRVAVLKHADSMTIEAQNALLKLLEEPPKDSVLILTASNENLLLPTIASRARLIHAHELSSKQLSTIYNDTEVAKISGGLPGLAHALSSDAEHPLKSGIADAKTFLSSTAYERLILTNDLSKNKEQLMYLLQGLVIVSRAALKQSASTRWHRVLRATLEAQNAFDKNISSKLILTNLALSV